MSQATAQEWEALAASLATMLPFLEEGQVLLVETRGQDPLCVQVSVTPDGLFLAATSNHFLPDWRHLDTERLDALAALGWCAPDDEHQGWWRALDANSHAAAAELLVATLKGPFEVTRLKALDYAAFSRDGHPILLPLLGLSHRPDVASASAIVEAKLADMLGLESLVRDDDGDWPLELDDQRIWVRARGDDRVVSVFAPALAGLTRSQASLDAVNVLNGRIRGARVYIDEAGYLIVSSEFMVEDRPDQLPYAIAAVTSILPVVAHEVRARVGGHSPFESPTPPTERPAPGQYL